MNLRINRLFRILAFSCASVLWAEDRAMPAFAPRSPVIAAQGGAFTASASGYESLFTNPAGFASRGPAFTALSVNPWLYTEVRDLGRLAGPAGRGDYWADNVASGAGGGMGFGIGYAGKGVGLGFLASGDGLFMGRPEVEGVSGTTLADFCIVGGLAVSPIRTDMFTLTVGADLRPGIRFYSALPPQVMSAYDEAEGSSAKTAALNGASVYQGAALAFDAGLIARFGRSLSLGFSVRDLMGTRYAMSSYPLGSWIETLRSEGLSEGGQRANDDYYVPAAYAFGLAYRTAEEAMPSWLGLTFQAEHSFTQDAVPSARDFQGKPWEPLNLGLEALLFKRLALRAGLDRGEVTAGLGLRLFYMDMNLAVRERELALEWALRF